MFVRIENPVSVIPSVEMLRTLGASSAKGNESKIGQFGSGFPYSLALLARKGLLDSLKICLGKDVYTFFTKAATVKASSGSDFVINEIMMKKQNGGVTNLNISDQFGAIDWRVTTMALREFISNAIDGTIEQGLPSHKTVIEIVDDNQCRSKDGTVRIYILLTEEIGEFIDDIKKHFLCLNVFYDQNKTILHNREGKEARFYRKGVMVGQYGERSLFHYNMPDLELKESRTLDSYAAREKAAEAILLSDIYIIERFCRSFDEGGYWENDLPTGDFDISYRYSDNKEEVRNNWREVFKKMYGDAILCESHEIAIMVRNKGHLAIVPNYKLGEIFNHFIDGEVIKTFSDVLSKDEVDGRSITPPTADVIETFEKIWTILESNGLLNGRPRPTLHCFSEITRSEGNKLGFYRADNKGIYILTDISQHCLMLTQTMLEEVTHHITGARDFTREFQDVAFRIAALMIH